MEKTTLSLSTLGFASARLSLCRSNRRRSANINLYGINYSFRRVKVSVHKFQLVIRNAVSDPHFSADVSARIFHFFFEAFFVRPDFSLFFFLRPFLVFLVFFFFSPLGSAASHHCRLYK